MTAQIIAFQPYLARRRAAQADPFGFNFWLALFAGMAIAAVLEWER